MPSAKTFFSGYFNLCILPAECHGASRQQAVLVHAGHVLLDEGFEYKSEGSLMPPHYHDMPRMSFGC